MLSLALTMSLPAQAFLFLRYIITLPLFKPRRSPSSQPGPRCLPPQPPPGPLSTNPPSSTPAAPYIPSPHTLHNQRPPYRPLHATEAAYFNGGPAFLNTQNAEFIYHAMKEASGRFFYLLKAGEVEVARLQGCENGIKADRDTQLKKWEGYSYR